MAGDTGKKSGADSWGFFKGITALLGAFPHASTGQRLVLVAISLVAAMSISIGTICSATLPAWAIVSLFFIAVLSIGALTLVPLLSEQRVAAPFHCRQVPIFPPDEEFRSAIRGALEEIRQDAATFLQNRVDNKVRNDDIRANIFLLALIEGGPSHGEWRLVIHRDFAINMKHPPELQLQFCVGQGATGVAYRDGTYQLSRRLPALTGGISNSWDGRYRMTPQMNDQIHRKLKWIISLPLLKPDTSEALGVLNIDGLIDISDDEPLSSLAESVQLKVDVIAKSLSLQPSSCVGLDQMGAIGK